MWVTGSYDVATNQVLWGTGNPVPMFRSVLPSRRQSLHQQPDLLGSRHRQDELVPPVHAGRHVGLRRGRHPHPDRRPGRRPAAQARHPFGAQRLPLQPSSAPTGRRCWRSPMWRRSTGPRASIRRPGKPVDYDPNRDIQVYSGLQNQTLDGPHQEAVPVACGRQQLSGRRRTAADQAPLHSVVTDVQRNRRSTRTSIKNGHLFQPACPGTSSATNPTSSSPIRSPARSRRRCTRPIRTTAAPLTTAGGLVFTGFADGTFVAYDDTSLEQLWKINVGTGFNAPPMTFEAGGKQYVAILTGLSRMSKARHRADAGASRDAQPDHAVRVRAVARLRAVRTGPWCHTRGRESCWLAKHEPAKMLARSAMYCVRSVLLRPLTEPAPVLSSPGLGPFHRSCGCHRRMI